MPALLFACCLLAPVPAARAQESPPTPATLPQLTMLFEPVPGLISAGAKGEPPTGLAVMLMKRLTDLSGIEFQIMLAPTARMLLDAGSEDNTCAAGVVRAPGREAQFKWAGPVTRARLVLLARADDTRQVNGPDELRTALIGASRGSAPADWLAAQQLQSSLVQDPATNLRMLLAGRIDFWAVNEGVASFVVRQAGVNPPPRMVHVFGEVDTFVACNRRVPDALIQRLDQSFERMRRNGELAPLGLK